LGIGFVGREATDAEANAVCSLDTAGKKSKAEIVQRSLSDRSRLTAFFANVVVSRGNA
jgi:hypothetical protein